MDVLLYESQIETLKEELLSALTEINSLKELNKIAQEALLVKNKEIISTSENFQILNEELETSKKEIEATNEELISTNEELKTHNELLAESYSYSDYYCYYSRTHDYSG